MNESHKKLKKEALIHALQSIYLSSEITINLTVREIECAIFWLRGYSAKEIAELFGISYRTVQTHIQRLSYKFQCRTRTQTLRKMQSLSLDKLLDELFYLLNQKNKNNIN